MMIWIFAFLLDILVLGELIKLFERGPKCSRSISQSSCKRM